MSLLSSESQILVKCSPRPRPPAIDAPLPPHLPSSPLLQDALAQFRRAAGLPSSLIALETSLGLRHDINWSDVLNTPDKSEKSIDVHVAMERRTDAVPDLTGR